MTGRGLTDKTVILTGAAGGIGLACAGAFLDAGSYVVLVDLEPPATQSPRATFVQADVSSETDIARVVAAAVERFGSIDVVVNNAAVLRPELPVDRTTTEQLDRCLAVNVRGPMMLCREAYPHLRDSRGCVVNVSSMAGVHGAHHHAAYSASKGALNALTKCMAIDWGGDGIRVNAVCPSSVLTPNVDRIIAQSPDAEQIIAYRNQINHLGYTARADEIASVVVFLASTGASFMTGAIVPVSGGTECGYGSKTPPREML